MIKPENETDKNIQDIFKEGVKRLQKVVIINCFDVYERRVDLLHEYFLARGHDVSIIESDFRHFDKTTSKIEKKDYIFIKSKPYYKNLSIARLTSHYKFAKDVFNLLETLNPDLLYILLPPNSLVEFAAKYKKKHNSVCICYDINDLWPEAMPIGRIKSIFPFSIWKNMRDKNLYAADYVITECDLFRTVLGDVLKEIRTTTIHMARRDEPVISHPELKSNEIHLCYLGSINHIIDIPTIGKIIKALSKIKPVVLHVIGDGESRIAFIETAKENGARVKYLGKIYDAQEKQNIFDKCHFGLNMMRKTVCVGLTMKSIDYFQAGLPILNNIKGDTAQIVKEHGIGYNIIDENIDRIAETILNIKIPELLGMRKETREVFKTMFTDKVFNTKLDEIMKQI